MEALRVLPPARLVGAVEALPLIEQMNQALADRGALYEIERDVYYSRAADPMFGAVSHLDPATMLELAAERGGDPARPGKKDPLDPLVWLTARPGEPSWDSAFGPGRPGWHVECAAIATACLGEVFDVQAGGNDLIFPHHEFSASHARAAYADGTPGRGAFARCYVHAGMVRLDGEKMSKSLGNLVFVSRLVADGVDPMAVRLAILAQHYRGDRDWTAPGLAAAQDRLARWRAAVNRAGSGAGPSRAEPETRAGAPAVANAGAAGNPGSVADPGAAGSPGSVGTVRAAGSPGSAGNVGDVPPGESVLAAVRERLADDLDAPGALAAVDRWALAVTAAHELPAGLAASAALIQDTVDALLGIAL
jgi:L-cysteine:1D-myo-inositol 2-amino-2-deoxy-alpha-D-glucopyranoside ligase